MALGDLHIFTGEEYVDTELAPLLNENFNSLKEYVDDAGIGSITFYSSLEEIGITPGQESFASIHSALPINSVLEYYTSEAYNFADIYPASYGNFIATRLIGDITIFHFTGTNQIIYVTHYHVTNNTNPSWTQIAKQSDLTNLSNSVVKTLDNVTPVNNNIKMWNWFHRYPYTDFTNGLTTLEWVNKGLFSCFFSPSQTFPRKPADWGQLINIPAAEPYMGSSEAFQLFISQPDGPIYYRGTNESKQLDEVPFKKIIYEGDKSFIASEAEAKAGTNNTKFMTPLRVKQAISALVGDSSWTISKGTNGWARENSTGLTVQWGYVNRNTSGTFTFPRTFTTCYYSNVMCSSNLVPYIKARSNTSITFNTNNGYNDDIKNWGDCYIFAIGVS